MRFSLVTLLTALGCDGGQSGENAKALALVCPGVTYETVDPTDTRLGFSAEEVRASLVSPVGVEWTELSEDGTVADALAFTNFTVAGPVRVADLTDLEVACPYGEGLQLVVPVAFDAVVGDGEVVGHGTVDLWAASLDPADLHPASERTFPVVLSGSYADALEAWWVAGSTSGTERTSPEVHLTLSDTWADLRLEIDVVRYVSDEIDVTTLWEGRAESQP